MANVCFVSPHPDDIELFCGGSLLKHVSENNQITIIMMTKGGKGTWNPFIREEKLEKIREQEARARYNIINNINLIFANFKDAEVIKNENSINIMKHLLLPINPDIIYIPEYIADLAMWNHMDHIQTSEIVLEITKHQKKSTIIRCYHSTAINYIVNIDNFYHDNNRAIRFYKSQSGLFAPEPFLVPRLKKRYNKHRRQWGKKIGCHYAEGFREINLSISS